MQSGELARLAGVSTDTLRHYERLGLLPRPPRTAGGYRDYPSHTLERVRLIRRALNVGFSLPELTAILKMRDQGGVPCQRVRAIAEAKLTQVKEKIQKLVVMRKQLEQTLEKWDAKLSHTRPGTQARLLESLPDESKSLRVLGLNLTRMEREVEYENGNSRSVPGGRLNGVRPARKQTGKSRRASRSDDEAWRDGDGV